MLTEMLQAKIRSREALNSQDIVAMLTPKEPMYSDWLVDLARSVAPPKQIVSWHPIYINNECSNECLYCGHRRYSSTPRMHLSSNRILPILDQLQAEGIHCVQLNFAFDHSVLKVTADICAKARDRGMTIGACTEGLSDTEISVLHTLGIERYFISLETFDETAYRHMHVAGRKADFHFQEMSPKRAVSAGMDVSIGVLLGLSDYHREIASLIGCSVEHSGPGPIGMFFNLLRPTDGAVIQDPPFAISPAELRKIVATLRLCHPRVRLMISTRDQQQSGLWGLADELLLSFRGRWGIGP